ncbi:MAG: aminodeoxychorismate synthase component I [Pyrinomonadaceae bacterium]|nr:aminodeoxychorismate synthase component I [Pyrinomonadaceae bacterium]
MGRAPFTEMQPTPTCAASREINFSADELLRALLRLDRTRRVSILDSGSAPSIERGLEARLMIAGFDPVEVIEAHEDQLTITRHGEGIENNLHGDPLSLLDERLARYITPRTPFAGACIATLSYDLARRYERLRLKKARPAEAEPDAVFNFYDALVVHDYLLGRTKIVSASGAEQLDKIEATLLEARRESDGDLSNRASAFSPFAYSNNEQNCSERGVAVSNFTRADYIAAVKSIKEHIFAGDIYQANLTQQFTCRLRRDDTVESLFMRLRRDNPVPFAAFIRRRDDTVISASPERFLKVGIEDGACVVEAWPIKGTRPRGKNADEDARLRHELEQSEKDRAENVMIVDLLRNDLGRVCRFGSVKVTSLCELQTNPTLFHLVSKVRGELRGKTTASQLLRATFPCGSITGAPKLRAMEIIDEIETAPRGSSMGAIGYLAFDGSIDLNVAIRTMVVRDDGSVRFNTGGGIVAESVPGVEYEESLVKASALFRALNVSFAGR